MKKMAKVAALVAAMALAAGFSACQKKASVAENNATGTEKASAAESSAAGTEKAVKKVVGKGKGPKPTPVNEFSRELTRDGSGVCILKYNGSAKNVVIPSEIEGLPVKEIASFAFALGS